MLASATLPVMGKDSAPFESKSGSPNPAKVITSTAGLSGYNLETLRASLTTSNLCSIFNGLISTPSTPVLLDCGASACTSPSLDAFEPETLTKLAKPIHMAGVGGQVETTMQGIIKYQTIDDNGAPLTLRVPGYYAPHIKQSLFSPQILFMTSQKKGYLQLSNETAVLHFPKQVKLTLHLDLQSRLFYMHSFTNVQQAADELLGTLQLTQDHNSNCSRGQNTSISPCSLSYWVFHHQENWEIGLAWY